MRRELENATSKSTEQTRQGGPRRFAQVGQGPLSTQDTP